MQKGITLRMETSCRRLIISGRSLHVYVTDGSDESDNNNLAKFYLSLYLSFLCLEILVVVSLLDSVVMVISPMCL